MLTYVLCVLQPLDRVVDVCVNDRQNGCCGDLPNQLSINNMSSAKLKKALHSTKTNNNIINNKQCNKTGILLNILFETHVTF